MLWRLIVLLTIVPLMELVILIELTRWWGSVGLTVAIVVGTGLLGAVMARREGLRVLQQFRAQLTRGEVPTDALLDGALVLVAAALLVTPGLLTDACGFLLLVPPSRATIREALKRWMKRRFQAGEGFLWGGARFRPISDEPPPGAPPMEDEGDG
ncbi:MAG: FxsA family protein [Planctomycetota bacterium]|jgi:UPF0716 protein FxsA